MTDRPAAGGAGPDPKRRLPPPPHPTERQRELPGQRPKPAEEDPGAPARLQAILRSPTYRAADQDLAFLARDDTRGVRLQLDYLKAELLLEENGIHHTVVVFGSTRIAEPARRRSARRGRLRPRWRPHPDDAGAATPAGGRPAHPGQEPLLRRRPRLRPAGRRPRTCASAAIPWW